MLEDFFIRHESFLCERAAARGALAGRSGYRGQIADDDRRVIARIGILSRLSFAPHKTKPELRHFCGVSFGQASS
jgi:hypothetical protein